MKKNEILTGAAIIVFAAGIQGVGGSWVRPVEMSNIIGPDQSRPLASWPSKESPLISAFGRVGVENQSNTSGLAIVASGEINLGNTTGFTALPKTGLEGGIAFKPNAFVFPDSNVVGIGATFSADLTSMRMNGAGYLRLGGKTNP